MGKQQSCNTDVTVQQPALGSSVWQIFRETIENIFFQPIFSHAEVWTHAVLLFLRITAYVLVLDKTYSLISFRLSGVFVLGRILCKLY